MKINKKVTIATMVTILIAVVAGAGFWLLNDGSGQSDGSGSAQTINGAITRIDPDCEKARYLGEDGEVIISEEPAICDNGDSIQIDDTHSIYTSSGLTAPEHAFDKHSKDWELGDNVDLVVVKNESGNYSLDCNTCGENQ